MTILDFFLFLWVTFALLDPDPDPATQINVWIRIRNPGKNNVENDGHKTEEIR
jgi:hypothetical protein